ncbi:MAG: zinc ribbon domain-containing protein [Methanoregula sp.]
MILVHSFATSETRWIGVDLNTTGSVAVAADIVSGKVLKLGKNIHYTHHQSSRNCTKLWKEGKLWKLQKAKTRERKRFKSALNAISRQIVGFAESLGSGIKFEKLFSSRHTPATDPKKPYEFSFDNGSFLSLQRLVERRAVEQGIAVLYINPAYTSKRCSRCGSYGRRFRKRFECPHCGYVAHADVNAAFNIAASPMLEPALYSPLENGPEQERSMKRAMRRMAKLQESEVPLPALQNDIHLQVNLLAVLE